MLKFLRDWAMSVSLVMLVLGVATIIRAGDGVETDNGSVLAQEPCVGPQALIDYFRAPPGPVPSADLLGVLRGDEALVFTSAMMEPGTVPPATGAMVYFFHAPEQPVAFQKVEYALADETGCLILMSGERAVVGEDGSIVRAAGAGTKKQLREMFKRLGFSKSWATSIGFSI